MAYQFSEDTDKSNKRITALIFFFLLGFIGITSYFVPIPSRERVEKSLEVIVLESIAIATSEAEENDVAVEEVPDGEETSPEDVVMDDFEGLLSAFGEALSPSESEDASLSDLASSKSRTIQSEMNLDFAAEGGLDVFGSDRPADMNADLLQSSGGGNETLTLKSNIVSGSSGQPGFQVRGGTYGGGGDDLSVRQGGQGNSLEMGSGASGSSELTAEQKAYASSVVNHLNLRERPLDPGIRAMFAQGPDNITTKETTVIGGQEYMVQLLYTPFTRTLHIAWIKDDTVYYFVDPALQNVANYYEKGHVDYDDVLGVVLAETEELSAQGPEAIRMYNLFLSWWLDYVEQP